MIRGGTLALALALAGGQPLVAIAGTPATFQLAQAAISERTDLINACRITGAAVTLYADTALTRSIGSVTVNSSVSLTGIVGSGIAQIKAPVVGWISAVNLKTCGDGPGAGLPSDIDTNPVYCRRLRNSIVDGPDYKDLDAGLVAREVPNGAIQTYQGSPDGPGGGSVVRITATTPESQNYDGRTWVKVRYTGVSGGKRVGWVSNGPIGTARNLAGCLAGQS